MIRKKIPVSMIVLNAIIIIGYLATFFVVSKVPSPIAWENGPIENAQVVILLLGGIVAFIFAWKCKNKQFRWFALMVAPLWIILALRELSWGAVFMEPLGVDEITGPWFSSTIQLWYKPAVYPVLAAVVCLAAIIFFVTKQFKTLSLLFRQRGFPVFELLLVAVGAVITTAAEGHAGLSIPFSLSDGEGVLLEEWVELFAYLALFAAQWRVLLTLKRCVSGCE